MYFLFIKYHSLFAFVAKYELDVFLTGFVGFCKILHDNHLSSGSFTLPFLSIYFLLSLCVPSVSLSQDGEQHFEERVLLQQFFRRVCELLQSVNGVAQLACFLSVQRLQPPALLLQLGILGLQRVRVQREPPVLPPQDRKLLRETLSGPMKRKHLLLQRLKLRLQQGLRLRPSA